LTKPRFRNLEREITDAQTGESRTMIIHEPVVPKRRGEDPGIKVDEQFVMVFPEHLLGLKLSAQENAVLILIASVADSYTGRAMYSTNEIADRIGVHPSRVSQIVTNLDRIGALTREFRGAVTINPLYVWRGEIRKRRELLKGMKR